MKNKVKSLEERVAELDTAKEGEGKRVKNLEVELANLRLLKEETNEENKGLKLKLQKSVEDVAKVLGDGYGRCLSHLSASGFDVSGHSFDEYIRDYAASV